MNASSSEANKKRFLKLRATLVGFARDNFILCYQITAILIGLVLGCILRAAFLDMNTITKKFFLFPGEIFLRMFKFVLLPLITSSLIAGIGK